MNDILSSLNDTERKRLRLLLAVLGLCLAFLFLISFRERRSFRRLEGALAGQQAAFAKLDAERAGAAAERARWEQAAADLSTLKEKHFYREADGVNALRLDLKQLFAQTGIMARSIKFDYSDLEKAKARKVNVTFNFTGSYPLLKGFLETVEKFPKFLSVERLDFVRITGGGSSLELRVVLAGYYANF